MGMNLFIIALIAVTVVSSLIAFIFFKKNKENKEKLNWYRNGESAKKILQLEEELKHASSHIQTLKEKILSNPEVSRTELFCVIMQSLLVDTDWFNENKEENLFVEEIKNVYCLMYKASNNEFRCVGEFKYDKKTFFEEFKPNFWFYETKQYIDLLEKMHNLWLKKSEKQEKSNQNVISLKEAS